MKKVLIPLLISAAMLAGNATGAEQDSGATRMFTVSGQVSSVREDAIRLEDIELKLADNVSVVRKDGRPGTLKNVGKGARVELLVRRGGIVQEIRLLK